MTALLAGGIFILAYIVIVFEGILHINKSTAALMAGVLCWACVFADATLTHHGQTTALLDHVGEISELIFFLIAAVTIVEIMSAHRSFRFITDMMTVRNKRVLLWLSSVLAFGLSALLDNLTTTILMITLLRKVVTDRDDRLIISGCIVIAANAGGCWTPIGDVTTTMLWIGGQISTLPTIASLVIPSIVCLIVSTAVATPLLSGQLPEADAEHQVKHSEPKGRLIFFLGITCLVSVPIFKVATGLPPFMGMLFGLSILWLATDLLHSRHDDREHLRVPSILTKVDLSGPLFFLGILLTVGALQTLGILDAAAVRLSNAVPNAAILTLGIGLASAVIDNVPLVAACMSMYDLTTYPIDSAFWQMLAYCAGTGGSVLIIGSAAGVALMTMEKVGFGWYLRRLAIPALAGYFAGFATYMMLAT